MTFNPILPSTGLVGFRLLERTEETQRALFDRSPEIARDVAYFEENIASITTAEDLVADRRLLRVALGAFGLDEEINKGAYIRAVLEGGTDDPDSFANRIVDPRYREFAQAFGFGNILGARTGDIGFATSVSADYRERQFEIAVGDQDESLRLALNFRREIKEFAASNDPEGAAWFSVMGDLPVRRVFEGAFGLGSNFSQLDVDKQRDILREFNSKTFGSRSLEIFQDDAEVDRVIERFLLRSSIDNGPSPTTPGFTALTLLNASQSGIGSLGLSNVIIGSASNNAF